MRIIGILTLFACIACKSEPEPIVFGKDACHACKMMMTDHKFGAELVTKKGKVYKFDDLNCMLNYYNSGKEKVEDFEYVLVIDYTQPEKLIDAKNAFYLKSEAIRSPMASEVAAFEQYNNLKSFKKEWSAIEMSWGEVVSQFK
ncbi:nitrous oxide reductase [Chryseotalea sanaruensis]|uniref:Nitrous oxide reductase n=2 Tax=Chryseotalea sanaruensis TaxID=2482724 RepID=A0A401UET9_9BACT|nr:nitrous oxide reductase [Chryseotalea sanaruensis]